MNLAFSDNRNICIFCKPLHQFIIWFILFGSVISVTAHGCSNNIHTTLPCIDTFFIIRNICHQDNIRVFLFDLCDKLIDSYAITTLAKCTIQSYNIRSCCYQIVYFFHGRCDISFIPGILDLHQPDHRKTCFFFDRYDIADTACTDCRCACLFCSACHQIHNGFLFYI